MIDMYGNYREEKNDTSDHLELAGLMTDVAECISRNMVRAGIIDKKEGSYFGLGAGAFLHETVGDEIFQFAARNESVSKLAFTVCYLYEQAHPGEMVSVGKEMAEKAGVDLEEDE